MEASRPIFLWLDSVLAFCYSHFREGTIENEGYPRQTLFIPLFGRFGGVPRMRKIVGLLLFVGVALNLCGCRDSRQLLIIAGSTSVQPLMEKVAEAFRKTRPGLRINVEGGGSGAGITATLSGTAQLGMSSRHLKANDEREKQLTPIQICLDAIVVIGSVANPIKDLTLAQLRDIFSGKIKRWKEVGGPDREIHLVIREEGSGTRSAFDELVMKDGKAEVPVDEYALVQDSMGGLREVVRGDRDAIGFISLGGVSDQIKVISVEKVVPSFDTVKSGEYKLIRPFFLLTRGEPKDLAKEVIDFTLSSATIDIMRREGLVSGKP